MPMLLVPPLWISSLSACAKSDGDLASDTRKAINLVAIEVEVTRPPPAAFALLGRHPDEAVLPLLVAELDSGDLEHKRAVAQLLGLRPWKEPRAALAPLQALLHHENGELRGDVAIALANLGDQDSFDSFVGMLKSDAHSVARQYAALALGDLGWERGIPVLQEFVEDQDAMVNAFARASLERLEFLQEHANDTGDVALAARAVWRMAGSSEDQKERLGPALDTLRSIDRETLLPILSSWAADGERPHISAVARWAITEVAQK